MLAVDRRAVEAALADQRPDGEPDLHVGDALQPHRVDAVGDGAADVIDVRDGVAREVNMMVSSTVRYTISTPAPPAACEPTLAPCSVGAPAHVVQRASTGEEREREKGENNATTTYNV